MTAVVIKDINTQPIFWIKYIIGTTNRGPTKMDTSPVKGDKIL